MVARAARLTLLVAALPAVAVEPPQVTVARGDGAADTARARVPLVISWDGGPAEVRVDGVSLGQGSSPLTTLPVRWGAEVVLVRDGATSPPARAAGVWSPADIAAWSGPGLRGARVTGLAPIDGGVWVSTDGGGVSLWWSRGAPGDGSWTHLDRRVLGADQLVDVSVAERTRWVARTDTLLAIDPNGVVSRWSADALGGTRLLGVEADGPSAWVWHDRGLTHVDAGTVAAASAGPCTALFATLDGPVAVCGVPRLVRTGERLPGGDDVSGAVRREGGWWISGREGLTAWVAEQAGERWDAAAVGGLARVGDGLVLSAGGAGAWARTIEAWLPLDAAQGLPGTTALGVAALVPRDGAHGRAWVATDRGVALARLEGVATPLPLAPLAASVPVRAVVSAPTGAAVATDDGLVWLGRGAPRGWDALVVAVGAPVLDLVRHGTSWWAVGPTDAIQLTRDGRVHRWPTRGEAVGVVPCGDQVGISTTLGLRWWTGPTQRTLSPTDRLVDAADPVCAPGVVWWRSHDGVGALVRGERRTWTLSARSLTGVGTGALVAGDDGLWWLTPDAAPARPPGWEAPRPLQHAVVHDGTLWALGADGTVWWSRSSRPPVPVTLAEPADRVVPIDADRAWVFGPAGLALVRRVP